MSSKKEVCRLFIFLRIGETREILEEDVIVLNNGRAFFIERILKHECVLFGWYT